ncbi:MAG: two-component system LytT family response regulator [Arenicella sp.]|jgi:two-component system LytT family response regulator
MKKIFIIEDEIAIREELLILLQSRLEFAVVGGCGSVKEALILLPNLQSDLVLMDIELTDGKSFEILEQLENIDFKIIFVTAYNHFAIRAIKLGALDYLLKPIDEDELNLALDKYLKESESAQSNQNKKLGTPKSQANFLANQLQQKEDLPKKIVLKTLHEMFFVDMREIEYCKGEGSYTKFYLSENQQIMVSKPLKEYEDLLPSPQFLRTHKSYLVNTDLVKSFNQDGFVVLESKVEVPVSVRKKESVLQVLSQK